MGCSRSLVVSAEGSSFQSGELLGLACRDAIKYPTMRGHSVRGTTVVGAEFRLHSTAGCKGVSWR
jgi:hypothetical protein